MLQKSGWSPRCNQRPRYCSVLFSLFTVSRWHSGIVLIDICYDGDWVWTTINFIFSLILCMFIIEKVYFYRNKLMLCVVNENIKHYSQNPNWFRGNICLYIDILILILLLEFLNQWYFTVVVVWGPKALKVGATSTKSMFFKLSQNLNIRL